MSRPNPRQFKGPHLQRNWKIGIQAAAFLPHTSQITSNGGTNGDNNAHMQDRPPSSRRRFGESSDSVLAADGFLFHEDPVYVQPAMQVDIACIFHKDLSRARRNTLIDGTLPADTRDIVTQARCKITITTLGPTPNDAQQVLYCDSQTCSICSTLDAAGVCRTARVHLQPFQVPEEKIYVERRDDVVHYLADIYTIKVEFQSAGTGNWPPLNLARTNIDDLGSLRHWTLSAEIANLLERNRRLSTIRLFKDTDLGIKTDFLVEIDVRWATLLPPQQEGQSKDNVQVTPAANGHRKEDAVLGNGHVPNGYFDINGYSKSDEVRPAYFWDDDMDEDVNGKIAPSRYLRTRGNTNYNLKDLSAKAQGRQPRRRLKNDEDKRSDPGARVLYRLPKQMLPLRELVVDSFSCCVCSASNQSFSQLRAHLFSHSQYEFEVSVDSGKIGHQLNMSCVTESATPFRRAKVYQLGKATEPFDLFKYVEGDESWSTSRLGPNSDAAFPLRERGKISEPRLRITKSTQRSDMRRREKLYVPRTEQPLFDPLSKAQLIWGAEVRFPEPDDSWLIQKHQDVVQDYGDVSALEKEYIKAWDAFILKKRILSEAFIGGAVVEFVNEKIGWLLDREYRVRELGKHLTVLIARGLDDETIDLVRSRILEARGQRSTAVQEQICPEAANEAARHISGGCGICGRLVRGPSLLTCTHEGCKNVYHDDCIRATARMLVSDVFWRCNACAQ